MFYLDDPRGQSMVFVALLGQYWWHMSLTIEVGLYGRGLCWVSYVYNSIILIYWGIIYNLDPLGFDL